ncbi:hypothetical protein O6H91_19G064400 [Diphasiastrum complanatum]|uniref:Uncharacterized protein n=1 Tax=Diphasiastrum complanatum TaxID=34168 RepID=A0ACC2AW03_DIPCM|nr:hypothetical protein O6H91_19G064400 [Diphasiastrum complanatum]
MAYAQTATLFFLTLVKEWEYLFLHAKIRHHLFSSCLENCKRPVQSITEVCGDFEDILTQIHTEPTTKTASFVNSVAMLMDERSPSNDFCPENDLRKITRKKACDFLSCMLHGKAGFCKTESFQQSRHGILHQAGFSNEFDCLHAQDFSTRRKYTFKRSRMASKRISLLTPSHAFHQSKNPYVSSAPLQIQRDSTCNISKLHDNNIQILNKGCLGPTQAIGEARKIHGNSCLNDPHRLCHNQTVSSNRPDSCPCGQKCVFHCKPQLGNAKQTLSEASIETLYIDSNVEDLPNIQFSMANEETAETCRQFEVFYKSKFSRSSPRGILHTSTESNKMESSLKTSPDISESARIRNVRPLVQCSKPQSQASLLPLMRPLSESFLQPPDHQLPLPPPPPPPLPPASSLLPSKPLVSSLLRPSPPGPPPPPPGSLSSCLSTPQSCKNSLESNTRERRPKMKQLVWDKIAGAMTAKTVWENTGLTSISMDVKELESLFAVNSNNPATENKINLSHRRKDTKIHVIDIKRAHNISIQLSSLRKPLAELCKAVIDVDLNYLSAEMLNVLHLTLPTKEDIYLLKEYKGDPLQLAEVEKYYLDIMKIPRPEMKIQVFIFKQQYGSISQKVQENLRLIELACQQMKDSKSFVKILEMVLAVGNHLNGDTLRGAAKGFKLNALLKLMDVKGCNKKTTLLHFVVTELMKVDEQVGNLSAEMYAVKLAANLTLDHIHTSLGELGQGISVVEKEILQVTAEICKELESGESFLQLIGPFLEFARLGTSTLKNTANVVFNKLQDVARYFGEPLHDERHTDLFHTMGEFLHMFDRVSKEIQEERIKRKKSSFGSQAATIKPQQVCVKSSLPVPGKECQDPVKMQDKIKESVGVAGGESSNVLFESVTATTSISQKTGVPESPAYDSDWSTGSS